MTTPPQDPNTGATRRLVADLAGLRFDALGDEVVEQACGVVLDFLGAALVGTTRPHVGAAAELLSEYGGRPAAWSLTGLRTSAPHAAYLNGLAGSSSPQMDDIWKESLGHPGVGVIPAALAVAEATQADGRSLVEAVVIGYEVAMRIGAALGKEGLDNGWHPRGGVNVFGAAAAAGHLRGLDASEMVRALSLAGNTASGLTGAVHFHDSWYTLSATAAMNGVWAADLAARGYGSGPEILEAPYGGYLPTLVAEPRWEWLTGAPGGKPLILRVGQKVHASSAATHAAIDATLMLVTDHDIQPEDVVAVTIHGFAAMVGRLGRPRPQTAVHAGMSIPYLVATAITHRAAGLEQVVEGGLDDPVLIALQERMTLVLAPDLDRLCPDTLGARIEITTSDGRHLRQEVLHAKGDPRNPLTAAELEAKFDRLAGRVLTPEAVERARRLVAEMPSWASPRPLMELVSRR